MNGIKNTHISFSLDLSSCLLKKMVCVCVCVCGGVVVVVMDVGVGMNG